MVFHCLHCGAEFNDCPGSGRKTCSPKCQNELRRARHQPTACATCGTVYRRHASDQGKYCSLHCSKWRGGRYKINDYVLVAVESEHPYPTATKPNGRKYLKEHRFVVEQSLGRYLEPSEIVHHINGIRDDNRRENLLVCNRSEHATIHWDLRRKEREMA